MIEIPVFPTLSSDFSLSITLDLVKCDFRIMWNTSTGYWMINSYEEPDNNLVFHGLKILPGYPMFYTYGPSFSGQIIAMKKGRDIENDITYANFGTGWGLYYVTAEEFDTWRGLSGF